MRIKTTFLVVSVLGSLALAGNALADAEGACIASLDAPGAIPPGASRDDMEAGCSCMASEASGNDGLLAEIEELSDLSQEDRMAAMSGELTDIVSSCFPG